MAYWVIIFSEKLSVYLHFLYKDQELPREAFGPTEQQFVSQEYFVKTFWHFFLSKIFFPQVLNVGLILPFLCVLSCSLYKVTPKPASQLLSGEPLLYCPENWGAFLKGHAFQPNMESKMPNQVAEGKGQAQELCFCYAWRVSPSSTERAII